jgi:ubiquitin-like-conjugating enzyme ATG3
LTPINHNSNFSKTGEISPEEFVLAGDYLVHKFPTWEWGVCPKSLQKPFLPPDKQFLVTRKVPSYQRANSYLSGGVDGDECGGVEDDEEVEGDDGDGWVKSRKIISTATTEPQEQEQEQVNDLDDLIDNDAEEDDGEFNDLEVINNTNDQLRKYDLYISYSTSYRVPKVYLVGFNSNGIPLLPKQMFDDINSDYKDKTATIETLPLSYDTTSISIHPCKHSSVMKVLMKHSRNKKLSTVEQDMEKLSVEDKDGKKSTIQKQEQHDTEDSGIRVDQYLIIFLKFIASVTPGIEYDYTMDAL